MKIEEKIPLLENILDNWKEVIGVDYPGYKGHVYRMIHCCFALRDCSAKERKKIIIAACFHDIGLWSDHTVDYLAPSIDQAKKYLKENNLEQWIPEIELMIDQHHKVRAYSDEKYPLVEVFRKGDLVDFSLGLVTWGLPRPFINRLKEVFPNAGFHKFLLKGAFDWFSRHPLRPPPFVKW